MRRSVAETELGLVFLRSAPDTIIATTPALMRCIARIPVIPCAEVNSSRKRNSHANVPPQRYCLVESGSRQMRWWQTHSAAPRGGGGNWAGAALIPVFIY